MLRLKIQILLMGLFSTSFVASKPVAFGLDQGYYVVERSYSHTMGTSGKAMCKDEDRVILGGCMLSYGPGHLLTSVPFKSMRGWYCSYGKDADGGPTASVAIKVRVYCQAS